MFPLILLAQDSWMQASKTAVTELLPDWIH